MDVERGTLSEDQVRALVRYLPFDVSFADENDVLLYWKGATYDDCDPRFIGRDVRDCHPKQNLPTLERILEEFKAGTKHIAEGWHEDDGRLKLTRYYAVRDEAGDYRGILEVNADLTEFRALSGERALPGW